MAGSALIIGGTGQVGQAAARRLLDDGWDVTVAHRGGQTPLEGVREAILDRQDDQAVDALLRQGYDVVVDLLAFRPVHADQLLRQAGRIGSLVVMSSAAVYRDPQGRTLQDVRDAATSPVFAHPVRETDPVVSERDDSYAGRKRAVEIALTESSIPSTMIRPGAIHGPRSPQPREWFYVKRILDGRRVFVHGFGGRGSLHPAAADNIAEMIRLAAKKPGSRILNAGDPGLPDEHRIAQALAAAMCAGRAGPAALAAADRQPLVLA